MEFTALANSLVFLEHPREPAPELKGDTFPHHPDTVYSVDESLNSRPEQIAFILAVSHCLAFTKDWTRLHQSNAIAL
jgi:hypothetical protein